jgi:hypothetical protein
MKSIGALLIATFSISCLPWITVAYVPFTSNGYDIDNGTDPICWKLSPLELNYSSNSFDLKNMQMQPDCFNGTWFDFKALDIVSSLFLLAGHPAS